MWCFEEPSVVHFSAFIVIVFVMVILECLSIRLGAQWRSLDLDSLVAILSHRAGWRQ